MFSGPCVPVNCYLHLAWRQASSSNFRPHRPYVTKVPAKDAINNISVIDDHIYNLSNNKSLILNAHILLCKHHKRTSICLQMIFWSHMNTINIQYVCMIITTKIHIFSSFSYKTGKHMYVHKWLNKVPMPNYFMSSKRNLSVSHAKLVFSAFRYPVIVNMLRVFCYVWCGSWCHTRNDGSKTRRCGKLKDFKLNFFTL